MPKFRKRPVEIEARQWGSTDEAYDLVEWADASVDYDPYTSGPSDPETGDETWVDGGWRFDRLPAHGCGCCADNDTPPTHWMPLEPPTLSGDD